MAPSPFSAAAKEFADRLSPGSQRELDNGELRAIFGVSRITALQRQEIVRALAQAGLEVVSGAERQPLIVRNPAAQGMRAAVASGRPWFKRKRTWAIGAVLFFVLVAALGSSEPESPEENASQPSGATATQTTATGTVPTERHLGPTRSELEDMVDDDLYAEALTAAAVLGRNDETYIARRIANRLARRAMFALSSGDRSRARFLVVKARDYPTTYMSRQASSAVNQAQARAKAAAAVRRAEAQARAAAREAEERAAREAEQAAADPPADVPDVSAPEASGPSTTNWCGKRDGDGDGIYCEGE